MSFASETKKELTLIEAEPCCNKAELAALIRMNGTIQFASQKRMHLDVSTENAAIARRIYVLIKQQFQLHLEILVQKKMKLKKNNTYIVRMHNQIQEILRELRIAEDGFQFVAGIDRDLVKKNCCKRAYLRGAFLAAGSVNHPGGSSYHLEISTAYEEHCSALCELANEYHLNGRCIKRKNGHVFYLKEGEKIIEFLNVIGAHQALLKFEDIRIMRDMRNSVNRIVNCETANLNKTIGASIRQINDIKFLDQEVGLENLPGKLREVAEVRLLNPEMNLAEIGEQLSVKVSKSGVNHRLRKIAQMAEQLRSG